MTHPGLSSSDRRGVREGCMAPDGQSSLHAADQGLPAAREHGNPEPLPAGGSTSRIPSSGPGASGKCKSEKLVKHKILQNMVVNT